MVSILGFDEAMSLLRKRQRDHSKSYRAMYSSYLGGIVSDPLLMMVPIDDHIVHRGDAIFEAIKFTNGQIYALNPHLDRLQRSAELLQLAIPGGLESVAKIIRKTVCASGLDNGLVRLYVSRGPGGFSANPYESIGSQLYVVVTELPLPKESWARDGVSCKTSSIPGKEAWLARVKSCNYLQNSLMKKEAVDAGVDFCVALNGRGELLEGSTENCAIINSSGHFIYPDFSGVLRGITLSRCIELLQKRGGMRIEEGSIRPEDAYKAKEMMFFGTTIDCIHVSRYDGHSIGDGKPGPIAQFLRENLTQDLLTNPEMLTPIA